MYKHVPSGGRAEIVNIKNSAICDIFYFSSATRGRFSNDYIFLKSMTTWSKSHVQIFKRHYIQIMDRRLSISSDNVWNNQIGCKDILPIYIFQAFETFTLPSSVEDSLYILGHSLSYSLVWPNLLFATAVVSGK